MEKEKWKTKLITPKGQSREVIIEADRGTINDLKLRLAGVCRNWVRLKV